MGKVNHISKAWPTFIGEFFYPEHEKIKNDLLKYFDNYMKNNPSRKSGENYKLYESQYNIHLQGNEYFKKLTKFMASCFLTVSNEANKKEIEKLKNPNFNVSITEAWFINYQKEGFVWPHAHGNCSWCCVYYVQIEKDSNFTNGSTYFQKTLPLREQTDFGSLYNRGLTLSVKPEEGKLVIWPNFLLHGSYPYTGKKNRIIVSANARIELQKNNRTVKFP